MFSFNAVGRSQRVNRIVADLRTCTRQALAGSCFVWIGFAL